METIRTVELFAGVGGFRLGLEAASDMIMNRFSRIEITIFFPNQIGNQFVSKNTFGIGNE